MNPKSPSESSSHSSKSPSPPHPQHPTHHPHPHHTVAHHSSPPRHPHAAGRGQGPSRRTSGPLQPSPQGHASQPSPQGHPSQTQVPHPSTTVSTPHHAVPHDEPSSSSAVKPVFAIGSSSSSESASSELAPLPVPSTGTRKDHGLSLHRTPTSISMSARKGEHQMDMLTLMMIQVQEKAFEEWFQVYNSFLGLTGGAMILDKTLRSAVPPTGPVVATSVSKFVKQSGHVDAASSSHHKDVVVFDASKVGKAKEFLTRRDPYKSKVSYK